MEAREAYQNLVLLLMREFDEGIGMLSAFSASGGGPTPQGCRELRDRLLVQQEMTRAELLELVEREAWGDFHLRLKALAEDVRGEFARVGLG